MIKKDTLKDLQAFQQLYHPIIAKYRVVSDRMGTPDFMEAREEADYIRFLLPELNDMIEVSGAIRHLWLDDCLESLAKLEMLVLKYQTA
jgi:hypothetical protein